MKTALAQTHVGVHPGQPVRVEIDVTNTDEVIDGVTAIVDGINPDWIRLERPVISLFPEATDRVGIVFDIPRTCPAGDYLVVVRIVSTIDPERGSVHDFWLTVAEVPGLDLTMRPSIINGGKSATSELTITNTGNAPSEVTVVALEPTRDVDCRVDPHRIILPEGQQAVLPLTLRGPRPWFGQPKVRQIHISAHAGDVVVERQATFNQKPRIPRGLVTALILASIVILWALIFLWVVSELRRSEPPAKAVGSDFITGPENIPLAAIAGTAEGSVTSTTTGDGIARITVEAQRVTKDGTLLPVGSAATDDDGNYTLPSLIPGVYELRFSADGYETVRYADADGDTVRIEPRETVTDLDVQMSGEPGRIVGQIDLPPGSEGAELTVTATLITNQPATAAGASGLTSAVPAQAQSEDGITFTQTTTDGRIDLQGLPTPGTYRITVSGPGFQTQSFEQAVGGGQDSVINTVNLDAATGQIDGFVQDGSGRPLGGVTVTARSGDRELQVVSPTAGDVGRFSLIDLPTPNTYVLTFQLEGYSESTVALSLGAGATEQVSATLIGGSGTITGAAQSPDGAPLGGITVRVLGDDFTGQTSTLTTGGAGGAAGSFSITDLPVPGTYTVTFVGTGVQSETLGTRFDAAGSQSVGTVVLLPLTSEVRGTVRSGGAGIADVTVTLSDGIISQTTRSANSPPGVFAFDQVSGGAYTLTFEHPSFQTQVLLVEIDAGVDATRDANLVAAP